MAAALTSGISATDPPLVQEALHHVVTVDDVLRPVALLRKQNFASLLQVSVPVHHGRTTPTRHLTFRVDQ